MEKRAKNYCKISLKILGLPCRIENRAKNGKKPPKTSWIFFTTF
jgi:hypothetical protein